MRALVQRVSRAAVGVDGETVGAIGPGLLVLLGITHADDTAVCDRMADKVRALRIFEDAEGRMNEPLGDREVLCVSQFTLYGDARKGNRPSFVDAARPEHAEPLYDLFCDRLGAARGVFGARMRSSPVKFRYAAPVVNGRIASQKARLTAMTRSSSARSAHIEIGWNMYSASRCENAVASSGIAFTAWPIRKRIIWLNGIPAALTSGARSAKTSIASSPSESMYS